MTKDTQATQTGDKKALQSANQMYITNKIAAVKKCEKCGTRQSFWDEQLANLEAAINIQCKSGNWDYDEYQYGLANGLIYAFGLMTNRKPQYLPRPKEWLADKKKHGGLILPK